MNPMERRGLAMLVLILAALLAASAAFAGKKASYPYTHTRNLVLPESPPEPKASGKCIYEEYYQIWWWEDHVTVTCRNLTGGNQYHVCWLVWEGYWWDVRSIPATADRQGRLRAELWESASTYDFSGLYVWVENEAGGVVLQEEGDINPPE